MFCILFSVENRLSSGGLDDARKDRMLTYGHNKGYIDV